MKEEDIQRDKLWRGLKMIVDAMMLNKDPEIAEIAAHASTLISTYGYAPTQAYTDQTGIINNLINDLNDYLKPEEREKIGIVDWVNDLDESNKNFKKLYMERVRYFKNKEKRKKRINPYGDR
ncbi:MAG: DUF6261 family protein [Tannerellaceae bacterium]|nr:DUF6261 family protein [Tannerellaceae bacterium]